MVMRSFIGFSQTTTFIWAYADVILRIGGGPQSSEPGSAGGTHDGCRGGSLFDELGCFLWKRHVGYMARLHFDRLGLCALRHHALLVRIDRSVFGRHHVPGGLVLPGGILNLMGERVSRNRHLRYRHELRLIPWD